MKGAAAAPRATVQASLQRPAGRAIAAFATDSVTIRSRLVLLVLAVLLPAVVITLWLITRTYDSERIANETTLRDRKSVV